MIRVGRASGLAPLWGSALPESRGIEWVVSSALEVAVILAFHVTVGQTVEVETVFDTGFAGFLALPPALVTQLAFVTSGSVTLSRRRRGVF